MATNKYPGKCRTCGTRVEADQGRLVSISGSWSVECGKCLAPTPEVEPKPPAKIKRELTPSEIDARVAKHIEGCDCVKTEHPYMAGALEGADEVPLYKYQGLGETRTVTLYILQDGRPVVTFASYSYDDSRCTYLAPRDLVISVLQATIDYSLSKGEPRYTPESAMDWLSKYLGCVDTDLNRLACGLDPW